MYWARSRPPDQATRQARRLKMFSSSFLASPPSESSSRFARSAARPAATFCSIWSSVSRSPSTSSMKKAPTLRGLVSRPSRAEVMASLTAFATISTLALSPPARRAFSFFIASEARRMSRMTLLPHSSMRSRSSRRVLGRSSSSSPSNTPSSFRLPMTSSVSTPASRSLVMTMGFSAPLAEPSSTRRSRTARVRRTLEGMMAWQFT